jgi:2-polyprenyl-3-methyl-5-hydroxy-6-metoxy-1,4-benzoquinol methylase
MMVVAILCLFLACLLLRKHVIQAQIRRQMAIDKLRKRRDIRAELIQRYEYMLNWIKERSGSKVIDIGCNTGVFDMYLAEIGYKVTGIDISEKAIKVALNVLYDARKRLGKNLTFKRADATSLEEEETGSYDWAVITEILEHVPNYNDILRQAIRVVKPKGRIYVSVPKDNLVCDPDHINVFTTESVKQMVTLLGRNIQWHNDLKQPNYLIFSFINA